MLANRFFLIWAGLLCLLPITFKSGVTRTDGQASAWLLKPSEAQAAANEPKFQSYEEAVVYVRSHYRRESFDTSRSSWITSAEYYHADGRGYLILGMRGKPYIFSGVPRTVWGEFKKAPSLGSYYHQRIKGRYGFDLQ